ncbi:MAG: hypothetical protein IPJ34_02055 [Myxococcales bacterium]|nr:hypothetical protein [Myxococcales bacterium]
MPPADTGVPSTDGGTWAGVKCGDKLTCTGDKVCCIGFSGSASYSCETKCAGGTAASTCDGKEDCTGTNICCAGFPSGASCKALSACSGFGTAEICHDDAGCSTGKTCKLCSTPGGGPAFSMCVTGGKCPF